MGAIEGNAPVSDNDWETVTRSGDPAIQRWIDSQLEGKSVTIVLIGSQTAGRRWINYEIEKSWNLGKGLLGIHIHNLRNTSSQQSSKGANPFNGFTLNTGNTTLASVVKTYDPPFFDSTAAYNHIKSSLQWWVEEAISIRSLY